MRSKFKLGDRVLLTRECENIYGYDFLKENPGEIIGITGTKNKTYHVSLEGEDLYFYEKHLELDVSFLRDQKISKILK